MLVLKLLFSLFMIGVFYYNNANSNRQVNASTIASSFNSYSLKDFWIAVYSNTITFVVIIASHLLNYSKADKLLYEQNFEGIPLKIRVRGGLLDLFLFNNVMFLVHGELLCFQSNSPLGLELYGSLGLHLELSLICLSYLYSKL